MEQLYKNKGQFSKANPKSTKMRKNKGHFKQGNKMREVSMKNITEEKPDIKQIQRLPNDVFDEVVQQGPHGLYAPNAEDQPGSSMLLRPRTSHAQSVSKKYTETHDNTDNEMRLVNNARCAEMWNTSFREHMERAECQTPHLKVFKEVKKGLGWKQSLACVNCTYQSPLYKLYSEVSKTGPGAKAAACNVGLQVGLQDSPIGNTRARMLIAATNTPPPSLSAMQRLSNNVGQATCTLNDSDMRDRKQNTKKINRLRGLKEDDPINVSVDVRYNSSNITSSQKMGQNASQAIGIALENQTAQKRIVSFHVDNKLCWRGSYLRNRGATVSCPGHPGCTATVCEVDPLSERNIGKKIGEDLAQNDVSVRYVATDGDGRSAEGLRAAMDEHIPGTMVERQADTTHLGQGMFRQTMRATFSKDMFPGSTAEIRKEQKKILAHDMKRRCHAILQRMRRLHTSMHKIAQEMPSVVSTTIDCYGGDCHGCRYQSIVCGGGKITSWWRRSPYLWNSGMRGLNMTEQDRATLRALLNVRLGVEALRLTKLHLDTNKNEAVNRALSVSLPKNVNYSRNVRARVSSTVHRLNYGAGDSLIKKLEKAGVPITRGRYVAGAMKQIQERSVYHLKYRRAKHVTQMKLYNRIRQMRAYLTAKYTKRLRPGYKKGQLDPIAIEFPDTIQHHYELRQRPTRPKKNEHHEHPYHKPLHYL